MVNAGAWLKNQYHSNKVLLRCFIYSYTMGHLVFQLRIHPKLKMVMLSRVVQANSERSCLYGKVACFQKVLYLDTFHHLILSIDEKWRRLSNQHHYKEVLRTWIVRQGRNIQFPENKQSVIKFVFSSSFTSWCHPNAESFLLRLQSIITTFSIFVHTLVNVFQKYFL